MGWIFRSSPCRCYLQAATIAVAAVSATATAAAQTVSASSPKERASATSPQRSKPMKPCPAFGPGFVQVPGSDLCIKIGGSVDVEVGR
jgi:hypothetical protein